ncbi:MAG TPA: cupin domain-containing protein [Acidimicrobiales bacterium]
MEPAEIIDALGLIPHPEGGWYRETWRSAEVDDERALGTAIYYLLVAGEHSHWHRVGATETWHHYAGGPLELWISRDGVERELVVLGTDLTGGERPQAVVPAGAWQAANPREAFALVGCTVVPGFDFADFELAPPDWQPGRAS